MYICINIYIYIYMCRRYVLPLRLHLNDYTNNNDNNS